MPSGDQIGYDELREIFSRARKVDEILATIEKATGGGVRDDDQTIVILERT